ncbi:aminotransferase class V-fold PLP-dependent enzyme [Cupriavidus taiwanensis]|uniref:aminotransferase class V-fold PLP-dependent enzyme n=1 Tax=Cupriavidus taiwanensis TaxID=164546 RepID=UPI000E1060FD|nr:aminotransferase class V-fold PLP-dependent enzyme [Cupriavidus taiwanensis]SOY69312.1 Cysteine desulfurase (Aminotransferase class V) [Cupriavidus taiwanensis]SOY70004.1 Cysteine desulfurase (Aminotransferase class V) [Cupriavidus taiwanensis]SOY92341.1 Cysteine desulfurase (Aminotransferase class V) [Cupriavidus taiwanensis]SOZ74107.1 Cysteine desulfurase (Aminotransferase class V) [Cupriavidus taiwanensis]SOZ88016.1 Cysteine desulfurase (Aminotransferase class V) [Cupriavidus taiwanensis
MDIQAIRADTPLTASTIYLDTAAASIPPDAVLDTVRGYLLDTGHVGIYLPAFRKETYARVEAVRATLAGWLNCAADELAFTKNATESISIAARGIAWQAGDEVLVADTEMLSNLLPWRRLEQSHGIVVKMVAANAEGLLSAAAFAAAITPRTRLLTFSHLPNSTGAVQPAAQICAVARQHGVLSLVNGAQSVGMLRSDVAELGCDVLAGCGRKALRATEGSGFLYVRRALIAQIEPMLVGWWNGAYDRATGALSLVPGARRFEAGCPIVPAILGLGTAIDYAAAIGIDAIEARVRDLTEYAVAKFSSIPGFELYGPADVAHRIGIVPFNVRGVDPARIVAALETQQCIIEAGNFMADAILARYGVSTMARVSLHYFNTHEEIDRVAALIRAAIA